MLPAAVPLLAPGCHGPQPWPVLLQAPAEQRHLLQAHAACCGINQLRWGAALAHARIL
jgi:hypothetical protein